MQESPHTLSPGPQRDEAEGYRPVSALAVAALIVAIGTALTIIGVWVSAKISGKPILHPVLLFVASLGVILALAAFWHIRRAQGTRGGRKLAKAALWVSLLSVGAYGAYCIAVYQAVRLQAQSVADQYFSLLSEQKPELAFRLTRTPEQQRTIEQDPEKIRARYGSSEFFAYNQSDLPRLYRTWGNRAHAQFVGVRGLDTQDPSALELNYVLRTPEGQFDVGVWTREFDDKVTGSREWQVVHPATRIKQDKIDDRKFTKLGRLCDELENECSGRFLRDRWAPRITRDELASIVRVNGKPLSDAEREKVVADILAPSSFNIYPGSGPLQRKTLPTMYFSPETDSVWLVHVAVVNAPSVDPKEPRIAALIKVRVGGKELVNELLKLAGPSWEQEPLLPCEEHFPELAKFPLDLKVSEIDLRTDLPRIAAPPAGPGGPGGPGGP